MDDARFWAIIDASRRGCDHRSADEARWQPAVLERLLRALTPDDIEAFALIFEALHARAYRWDLWHAAYVIAGGCSDDGFADFRSGLIGLGREVFEDALRDPLTLARLPRDTELSQEGMRYAARRAYEGLTGRHLAVDVVHAIEPAGGQLDEEVFLRKYAELERRLDPR
ncbi:DUF4240 domain-containing protein [Sandaracinus amylolyticus]|uniref:DUF4240 domain-containing protein n=1 Tax=Sandaracinus amylolyticus TaxID=927083 RepID=UPI001F29A0E4|nr:DUF4240 domain-containing protein [Sandaracinus amylolyticus]UJR85016.1 Hypothetical protein I5071_70950 [Sandaracinus amylolyticus]